MAASGGGSGEVRLPHSLKEHAGTERLVVVLEQASLETIKTKKGYELLNCDDHLAYHRKLGRDPADSRPDIVHQLLLTLLDSPLNKAGKLEVFVETQQRVLIQVSPQLRLPRTFKRFAGLMVQLLHKMKIRAATSDGKTLLRVVKHPVSAHLPPGAPVYGAEVDAELAAPLDFLPSLPKGPVVFVIGAMAKGNIKSDLVQKKFTFSRYPLSADVATARLLAACERHWGIY